MTINAPEKPALRVIGQRVDRYDATDKVTGSAQYGADIRLPNMLYGRVLRSPHGHARIRSIDTSAAEALTGVKAVITAADLPVVEDRMIDLGETTGNLMYQSNNILARDKVLYFGHAVAAVCATDAHIAEQALALIKVDYEVLPAVLDVMQAMQPDAPILLDKLRTKELGGVRGDQPTNIAEHVQHLLGDLDAGFAQATVIVEREFHTAMVHQGYIEPHNATALYTAAGQLTVWCSTQGSFGTREQIADILDIPMSAVTVKPTEIGGGFGGKNNVYLEPLAALLSWKSGHRPVQLTMNRAEVLAATGPTSGSYIRVKMGANAEGKITAAEVYLAYEAGAYPGSPVGAGAQIILSPYNIENLRVDGYDVLVNKPRTSAYRAPGGTNAAFAAETVVDELAEKLNLDPIAFRLLNAAKEGDRRPDGPLHPRIGHVELLETARKHPHYQSPVGGKNRGRGVASGYWGNHGGRSSASASLNHDGSISLIIGSVDLCGTRTTTAMQLAETMGLNVEDIIPQVGDTNSVADTEGTYGSRTTVATGIAAYQIGHKLIAELKQRVALLWEIEPEAIHYDMGVFSADGQSITFKEIAKQLNDTGGPMMVAVTVDAPGNGAALATHIVDVEVDVDTGKVEILRYTALQDVGKAVHPDFVEGQIQGGAVQGIGWALNEAYLYDANGRLLNAGFLDYRMPTSLDVPMIEAVMVEVANPFHPYGVRGVGEVPIVPPAGAIANAIYDAVGVRLTELPMSPAVVLEALWAKQEA